MILIPSWKKSRGQVKRCDDGDDNIKDNENEMIACDAFSDYYILEKTKSETDFTGQEGNLTQACITHTVCPHMPLISLNGP